MMINLQKPYCQREVDGTWRCPRVWTLGRESGCRPRLGRGWWSPPGPGRSSWSWWGCWLGWRPAGPDPASVSSMTGRALSEPGRCESNVNYSGHKHFLNRGVLCDELVTRDGDSRVTSCHIISLAAIPFRFWVLTLRQYCRLDNRWTLQIFALQNIEKILSWNIYTTWKTLLTL